MAGTILVSESTGLPTSTFAFNYLSDHIRSALLPIDKAVADEVFSPMDEGGMSYISAANLEGHAYRTFATAVSFAAEAARHQPLFDMYGDQWADLLAMVNDDLRMSDA